MDVKFVNVILESIISVITMMTRVEPTPGKPSVKKDDLAKGEITGLMRLDGKNARVSIAVSFQESVIRGIAANMLPPDAPKTRGSLADLAGEIANMVAGDTKRRLEALNYSLEMSLPIIIYGQDHSITHRVEGTTILLPIASDAGGFFVEICYQK